MASVFENTEDYSFNIKLCVRSFYENSCKMALDKYNSEQKLKNLIELSYYSYFVEKPQLKILFYKLYEVKLKKQAELIRNQTPILSIELEKEKKRQISLKKELAHCFVSECSAKAIADYQGYLHKVEKQAVKIQRSFRRSLTRLLNKMEYMNFQLKIEEEQALQRKRNKIMKK